VIWGGVAFVNNKGRDPLADMLYEMGDDFFCLFILYLAVQIIVVEIL
jgi:hypothetical protein